MKTFLRFLFVLCVLLSCFYRVPAALAAAGEPGCQLTVEMRDGSRIVGKTVADTVSFHAAALGDMKLAWAGIKSIEYAADSSPARLTATNGDTFAVEISADTLPLETGFGKTDLPVKLIKGIKILPASKVNALTTPNAGESGFRLTLELRDSSHIVGKGLDDSLNFHSTAMGDLKLTWAGIRSIEYATTGGDTAKLTATNGDVYEVQFASPAIKIETSFGQNELPVKNIQSIKVSSMSQSGQLSAGLVALWSGEGDGKDSVSGNMATLTGVSFAEGKVGQAFVFNNFNSKLKIAASPNLNVGSGDGFTIATWINPANLDLQDVCEWNSGTGQVGVNIGISAAGLGAINGNIMDTSGVEHNVITASNLIVPDSFQHIALTYDKSSGVASFYWNGSLVASTHVGIITPQTSYDFFLGNRPSGVFRGIHFQGKMDEAAIYNRALTASEIQAICSEQNNGEPLPLSASVFP